MIYDSLFDWQKQIVDGFYAKEAWGLWLDMGLGKTPISLALAEKHGCDKILIVSINKKACEGEEEHGSFFWWAKKMAKMYALHNKKCNFRGEGPAKWRRSISPSTEDILLVNYEALYSHKSSSELGTKRSKCKISDAVRDFIASCEGKKVALIVDESHKIKETNSLQTIALEKIQKALAAVSESLWTYLLTGTPFTKGFEDVYSQLRFLGYGETKTHFIDRFCERGRIRGLLEWQQPIVGYKNIDELYALVHRYALTVRTETAIKLPSQVFSYEEIPNDESFDLLTAEEMEKKRIEAFAKKRGIEFPYPLGGRSDSSKTPNPFFRNIAFPDGKWEAETAGSFWMRARQMSIGFQGNSEGFEWFSRKRLDAFKKLLEENEDNYVVFYNYEAEFFELFDICCDLGYSVDVCNGNIKSEYFYARYLSQPEGKRMMNKKNVILANFRSGAAGSNWQAYDKCVLFSLPGYGDWQQSLKRVHRVGQKNTVIYHVFWSSNWLDRSMMKALRESKEYDKKMFEADLKRAQSLIY